MGDYLSGPSRPRVGVEGLEMLLEKDITVLTAPVKTRVSPSLLPFTIFTYFLSKSIENIVGVQET